MKFRMVMNMLCSGFKMYMLHSKIVLLLSLSVSVIYAREVRKKESEIENEEKMEINSMEEEGIPRKFEERKNHFNRNSAPTQSAEKLLTEVSDTQFEKDSKDEVANVTRDNSEDNHKSPERDKKSNERSKIPKVNTNSIDQEDPNLAIDEGLMSEYLQEWKENALDYLVRQDVIDQMNKPSKPEKHRLRRPGPRCKMHETCDLTQGKDNLITIIMDVELPTECKEYCRKVHKPKCHYFNWFKRKMDNDNPPVCVLIQKPCLDLKPCRDDESCVHGRPECHGYEFTNDVNFGSTVLRYLSLIVDPVRREFKPMKTFFYRRPNPQRK